MIRRTPVGGTASSHRRHRQRTTRHLALGVALAFTVAACTSSSDGEDEATSDSAAPSDTVTNETVVDTQPTPTDVDAGSDDNEEEEEQAPASPPGDPAQTVTRDDVDAAIELIPDQVEAMREASGVPGMAVAIVFDDEVVYSEGFGVRELGGDDPVDADTVFQIASLSKAVSATAVAGVVGDGTIAWDDPVIENLPDFALSDPYVTDHVTYADLFSHRSGLPDHAGDRLEDLGYDRQEVFDRLVQQPLSPFRAEHLYTNFGLTVAAEAAANAAGTPWEDLIQDRLFTPAGMTRSSARFADYMAAEDRAVPHQRDADGNWIVTTDQRDPDPQSAAGGVSSTANDLGQWLRLQLDAGALDGESIIDPDALLTMHTPHSVSNPPRTPSAHTSFYGLGTGIGVRDDGYTKWSHSGAFLLGTGTNFAMVPGQQLGVAVITNGQPVGLAEATSETVLDLIIDGEPRLDWLSAYMGALAGLYESETPTDWSEAVADPAPPAPPATYVGTYANDYYGPMTIDDSSGTLVMTLGPAAMTFELTPFDGDTFLFTPPGENSVGPTGIVFDVSDEQAVSVTSEFYDATGLGTWNRAG